MYLVTLELVASSLCTDFFEEKNIIFVTTCMKKIHLISVLIGTFSSESETDDLYHEFLSRKSSNKNRLVLFIFNYVSVKALKIFLIILVLMDDPGEFFIPFSVSVWYFKCQSVLPIASL